MGLFRRGDNPIPDPPHRFNFVRVVRNHIWGVLKNLSTGLVPKVLFIALGQEQELPPLRVGSRGAADHQQHDPTRKPG